MALGSEQYNWQDPMRNAGIIAQAENNDLKQDRGRAGNRKIGLIMICFLLLLLLGIIMVFIIGNK